MVWVNAMKTSKNKTLSLIGVAAAACLIYAISGGVRANYGLIRGAISASSGVDYASVSFLVRTE